MTTMTQATEEAQKFGLYMDSYSPGDGVTRYRFFAEPSDYFGGRGIYTALGAKERDTFISGWRAGRDSLGLLREAAEDALERLELILPEKNDPLLEQLSTALAATEKR